MKFIATSAFLNVPSLNIEPIAGAPHEKEIPKGARFSIGKSESFHQLRGEEKEAIAQLWNAGRIVSESNTQAAKLIDHEVEMEKKHAERIEKQAQAGNSQAFVEQFMAVFRQMTAKKA